MLVGAHIRMVVWGVGILLTGPASSLADSVGEASRREPTDRFAIYSGTLDGKMQTLIASDPTREINHAHLSPDRSLVAFTRYNLRDADWMALEANGYFETEIVVCAANGDDCKVVLPARRGIIAANASWTPDGQNLLFVSNDTSSGLSGISIYDLKNDRVVPFLQPPTVDLGDPHMVMGSIVVTTFGATVTNPTNGLAVGSSQGFRGLTSPRFADYVALDPPLGDFDPKLSPDGKKVAVMRHLAQDDWAIVIVDVATGRETNLSGSTPVDAVPEWSSDGKLLLFWHVDRNDHSKSGIYTMRADGTQRTRVPLPSGYFYTMPTFVPNGGSAPTSQIIYSARLW
jgi:Tol biopolymer transport system component